jgi:predicted nucleotidyltransferase
MDKPTDSILQELRAKLDALYGSRLERLVLFGSRARGDDRPDSDYDVAVFLEQPESFWKESGRLAAIGTDILFETGAVINVLPFRAGAYKDRSPLMSELRRDGLDL